MVTKSPASWKQKRALPPPAVAGLKKRRLWATLALLATIILAIIVAIYNNVRIQHTLILRAGKLPQENQFALPPVRYVEQSWTRLDASLNLAKPISDPKLRIDKLDDFNNEGFRKRVLDTIGKLKGNDALIVWVNGTGIVCGGEPMIVGDQFRLPASSAEFKKDGKSIIEVSALLDAMGKWKGPKLLVLDWGQEVFEPRIDLLGNNFISSLEGVVKRSTTRPSQTPTWVLVSHVQGQISLIDSREKQSLFDRAMNEALLNDRQLPEKVIEDHRAALPKKAKSLTLSSLAEYVHRRVKADSQDFQTPWLFKCGVGVVSVEGRNWSGAENVELLAVNARSGRPIDLPALSASPAVAAPSDVAKTESKPEVPPETNSDAFLPKSTASLEKLWKAIDAWRTPKPETYGWSEAALSPLSYKSLSARALDIDLKVFAGWDTRDTGEKIESLVADIEKNIRTIDPAPETVDTEVDAAERDKYVGLYRTLREQRQAACLQLEARRLFASLRSIPWRTIEFDSQVAERIEASYRAQNPSEALSLQNAAVDRLIRSMLVMEVNRGEAAACCEIMLRSSALSAQQRMELRKLQAQISLRDRENKYWLDQPLKAPPINVIQRPWQGNANNLANSLLNQPADKELELEAIADVDPRDLQIAQDAPTLWSSIKMGTEFPKFPQRPEPPSIWLVNWDQEGQATIITGDSIRLDMNKDLPLALVIKQTGTNPIPFPALKMIPSNISIFVEGNRHDEPFELERAWFKSEKGGYRLSFRVARAQEDGKSGSLSLQTSEPASPIARSVRKLPADLPFDLPAKEPIELQWGQSIVKDGARELKLKPASTKFSLTPFAGRESKFQLAVKNIDTQPHQVELRLFALPLDSEGVYGQCLAVPDLRGRKVDFGWSEKINSQELRVAGLAPPKTPDSATPPAGQTPPPVPAPSNSGLSIAGGAVLQMIVDDRPPKNYMISFRPRAASTYVEAKARMDRDNLTIEARWIDLNNDRLADLAPDDLASPEMPKPLTISWDPLPWSRSNNNIMAGAIKLLNEKAEWSKISSAGLRIEGLDQEVWLDVDGTPRSLIYTVRRDGRSEVTRPDETNRDRSFWRRYTLSEDGKKGRTYVPYEPAKSEKDVFQLKESGMAVFPNLKGMVELQLAVDLPGDDTRCSVLLAQVPKLSHARSRHFQADLRCVGEQMLVRWAEQDLRVQFDFSNDQITRDREFKVGLSAQSKREISPLPSIMADLDAPELVGKPSLDRMQIVQDSPDRVHLKFRARDASGKIIVSNIMAKIAGKPAKPVISEPVEFVSGQNASIELNTAGLEVGTHVLDVKLRDPFPDHEKAFPGVASLRVHPIPKPVEPSKEGEAPPVIGDLRIVAKLPEDRRARNEVTFKIEPDPEMTQKLGPAEILCKDVKLGSYKVTATYSEASSKYLGSATIEITKKQDFAKVFPVPLIKKD